MTKTTYRMSMKMLTDYLKICTVYTARGFYENESIIKLWQGFFTVGDENENIQ